MKQYRFMNELTPNFDREGRPKFGIVRYILTLGGLTGSKGLMRWFVVAMRNHASRSSFADSAILFK